ncbi:Hsp20/alpha crystallin family protein [Bacillus andreraoultii]|uniref:Hsp20/alpha crystallin family protein n=1 Tax=Bacillus andreraoultii TaxID=1499685 RepID=UPI0005A5FDB6|nr:Hsp20/alpha crystallin family protein [Bacillus andreraoultii]
MNHQNGRDPFDSKAVEKWFDEFFLNPLTSYLDETVFRIDLYDSESAFIVEAILPNCKKENIDIIVNDSDLTIKVRQDDQPTQLKSRTVTFPIPINQMKMTAHFNQDLLEIKLYKNTKPNE